MGAPRTLVMGVLNVTPDSFSDGGRFDAADDAIARGLELQRMGADIIDIGGESTRPGATPVDPAEEQRRVLRVIERLAAQGAAVSVDTLHASTARAAVAAGARYVNDVSGGLHDPDMLRAVAETDAVFIAGHWRGIPDPQHQRSDYGDVVTEVRDELLQRAADAERAGIPRHRIVLDPGLGFDKTGPQCWELLRRFDELQHHGYPVMVGASRKRMTAEVLRALPEEARQAPADGDYRDLATSVVSALSARAGAWGVRVHDVPGTVQALAVERAWGAAPAAAAAPSDVIALTGLEVFAHHGVFDFEREQGQTFIIDAAVTVDMRAAAAGDELAATVHYGELAEALVAAIERDPVDLIETVAERAVGVALSFAGVHRAKITVHKPDAPIDATFGDVSVTLERTAAEARA